MCIGEQLLDEFPDWLQQGAKAGPILLVLDSVSAMLGDHAHMAWLPRVVPAGVCRCTLRNPISCNEAARDAVGVFCVGSNINVHRTHDHHDLCCIPQVSRSSARVRMAHHPSGR